jgi:regulator of protease activity HflC (stomatin/prohibitin superfamily)
MHKQKTAEQERRQIRLLATGRKEASAQDKEGVILRAQGDKASAILKAEGEAKSIEIVAAAQSQAIKMVSEAANQYFKENAQLNKKLDVIRDTFAQQTKIVVPSSAEILNVLGFEGTPLIPIKSEKKSETEKSGQKGS